MLGVVLALGSVGLIGTAVWAGAFTDAGASRVLLAFAAGSAGSLLVVPSSRSRQWTIAPAVLAAVSLVGSPPWPATVAVVAGVVTTQATLTACRSRSVASPAHLLGVAVMFIALACTRAVTGIPFADAPRLAWTELAGVLSAGVAWFVIEGAAEAATVRGWSNARRQRLRRMLSDWPIALVAVATAVTLGVMWKFSLGWALAVSLVPYAIAHHLGVRVARGREIAGLTVRALGRLPEAAGLSPSGHAQHVADLSVAMGKLDGLVGPQLEELEVAAHLHDIGLLATTTSTFHPGGFSSSEIAEWGADILGASRALRPAAEIVRSSRDPFRFPGADPDPGLDRRSQIVQVACRVVDSVESGHSLEGAVEALYDLSLFQLDPHVVALVRPAALISEGVLDELSERPP